LIVDVVARRLRAVEDELRRNPDDYDAEAAAIAARGAASLERLGRYVEANDAGFRSFALAVSALALGFAAARTIRSLAGRGAARRANAKAAAEQKAQPPADEIDRPRRVGRRTGRSRRNGTVGIRHGT
jgi:histidinol dehydrogenase